MTKNRASRSIRWLTLAAGAALVSTGAAVAQPANDLCANAQSVAAGSATNGTNVAATSDLASTSCAFTPTDDLDVWFKFRPFITGTYNINTNGSTVLTDTTLSIFPACGGAELFCDDDAGVGLLSSIVAPLTANTDYYIRVAGWDHGTGAFVLNVSNPILPGGTDACASATVVSAGSSYQGDNSAATSDVAASSCSVNDSIDVWFSFSPSSTAFYNINTEGSTTLDDTTLQLYTGCGGAEIVCDDDAGTGFLSAINTQLNAGTTYLIRVAGYDGATGQFLLNIGNPVPIPGAPANDACAGAVAIGALPFASAINIAGATDDADLASCNDAAATTTVQGVWYTYNSPVNRRIRVTENSVNNTFLSVFTSAGGCAGPFTEVAGTCGFDSFVDVTAGTTYYILVGAFPATPLPPPVNINLSVVEVIPPSNDNCTSPQVLSGALPITFSGDSTGAGSDVPNSSCPPTPTDNLDVWFSYTAQATASGTTLITTEGTPALDTSLSVWSACGGTELFCDDDGGTGLLSRLNVTLTTGTTYLIRVAGYAGTFGPYTINVSAGPVAIPLTNDTCSTAITVTGTLSGEEDTTAAANENAEPAGSCNSTTAVGLDNSVWFTFTPGSNGTLAGIIDGDYDIVAILYTGSCGSLAEQACYDLEPIDLSIPDSGSAALVAGTQYWLAIGDWGTADGGGSTSITITVPGGAVNGACCSGATCSATSAAACTGANTSFAGTGTTCNAFGVNNTAPCCLADYNHVGGVTVQDIFDFLAGYFSGSNQANINGGTVTVQDIFDFLAAYFGGCV